MNRSQTLTHISNGPSGEIWLLEKGREEVLACLVLEIEGSWELLGVGTDESQGEVFLRHPREVGFNVEVKNESVGPLEWRTRPEAKVEEMDYNIPAGSQGEKLEQVEIQSTKLDRMPFRHIKALNKWKAFWARNCS